VQSACFYVRIGYPAILFNNSSDRYADMFDRRAGQGVVRIASVATEPTFVASSLMIFGAFGTTLAACEERFLTQAWAVPVALVLALVAASASTSGFVALAVLGLLLARRPGVVLLAGLGVLVFGAVTLVRALASGRHPSA
jgi:hypothetical protein